MTHYRFVGYGRKTGVSGYDSGLPSGARVIEIHSDPFRIKTWIREEDKIMKNFNIHKANKTQSQYKCHTMTPSQEDSFFIIYLLAFGTIFMLFLFIFIKYITRKTVPRNIKTV